LRRAAALDFFDSAFLLSIKSIIQGIKKSRGTFNDCRTGGDRRESSDLLGRGGDAWLWFLALDSVERSALGVAFLRLSGSGRQGALS
jgi:hypothetical protein